MDSTQKFRNDVLNHLKLAIKLSLLVAALIVFTAFGQFAQVLSSAKDLENQQLLIWANNDKTKLQLVQEFRDTCLISGPIDSKGDLVEPVSKADCASAMGHNELWEIVQNATDPLDTYAWPLSMFLS